jgi:magnesium chelatase family protein
MDELPEFPQSVLEVLRQPLEDRFISISRAAGTLRFPADFMFIAACNPCPCGNLNNQDRQCSCSAQQILRYQKKISGPLLDRIDLHLTVPKVNYDELTERKPAEASVLIRKRVEEARQRQRQRFAATVLIANAEMRTQDIKHYCRYGPGVSAFLREILTRYRLSARSFFRVIRVAQTIADLDASPLITIQHLAEACQYRPQEQT